MDIKKLDMTQLKALAYDTIAQLENVQQNLALINKEITSRPALSPEIQEDKVKTGKKVA